MKKIFGHTILSQLVVFSLLISVVPVIVIFSLLFTRMEKMVESELNTSHQQTVSQYTKNVEEKLARYQESISYIANNTALIQAMESTDANLQQRGQDISEEVAKSLLLDRPNEISNCVVYSLDKDNPVYGSRVAMMEAAEKEPWYRSERMDRNNWFHYYSQAGKTQVLSLVMPVFDVNIENYTKQQLGSVKLDIDLGRLLKPAGEGSYTVIVYDDNDELLYASDEKRKAQMKQYLEEKKLPEGFKKQYMTEHSRLDDFQMNLLFLFHNSELLEKQGDIYLLVFPALLLVLLIALGFAYLYSRKFSSRVEQLVRKFEIAETGDLAIRAPIPGQDEISQLDKKFSHMLKKLEQLIQKEYVQELEKKEAQFRNLQLQINPHFLYNTLETISSLAAVRQVFPICDMCQKLGEIFRYSIGKNYGEYVTVEEELRHTQNYVFIQKMRYSRFAVFYNVEIDTKKQKVLRFILQPIVENAILHGLRELAGSGTLEISIYNEETCMVISVADDGVGMEKEKVEELSQYINSPDNLKDTGRSIGIRNVNQRIRLSCGEEYGITIQSSPHGGSSFFLKLPLIFTEGDKDELQFTNR